MAAMNGARTPTVEDPRAIRRIIQEEVDKTNSELETTRAILLKIQEFVNEVETGLVCADILPALLGLLNEVDDSQARGRNLLRNNDERPPIEWVQATIDWVQNGISLNQRLADYRNRLYNEFPAHVVAQIERVAPRHR